MLLIRRQFSPPRRRSFYGRKPFSARGLRHHGVGALHPVWLQQAAGSLWPCGRAAALPRAGRRRYAPLCRAGGRHPLARGAGAVRKSGRAVHPPCPAGPQRHGAPWAGSPAGPAPRSCGLYVFTRGPAPFAARYSGKHGGHLWLARQDRCGARRTAKRNRTGHPPAGASVQA